LGVWFWLCPRIWAASRACLGKLIESVYGKQIWKQYVCDDPDHIPSGKQTQLRKITIFDG
jgi:hypothetical protein